MKKLYKWTLALILLSFVTTGFFLTVAPDTIPVHYDIQGNIDRFGSKYEFLLFPGITTLMGLFLAATGWNEKRRGRDTNETVVGYLNIAILIHFNAMWVFFMWKAVSGSALFDASPLISKGLLALTMATLIPLGNFMPRVQRNAAFGLRTKWSMADDVCWQKSQRFGGFLIVCTGILGVALICILPIQWGGYAMLVLFALMIPAAVLGSYQIWKKEQQAKSA